MSFETIWEKEGVCQRFYGQVTAEERAVANNEIHEHPRFETIKYWIVDALEIKAYELNEKDARVAAYEDWSASRKNGDVRIAFVSIGAKHQDNIRLFLKVLDAIQGPWKGDLFEDLESARNWVLEGAAS